MIADTQRAIEAVFRIESARLIAALARRVRDVGLAEELAQDALIAALEHWPQTGIPEQPAAWLMATAKRRAIDHFRRVKQAQPKFQEMGREQDATQEESVARLEAALDDDVGSCSPRVTRCCPPKRVSPSPYGCSVGSARSRSRVLS